ncbi:hypothetical protein GCM10028819_32540 [Spirosoma humi]
MMEKKAVSTDERAADPSEWKERLTSYCQDTGYWPSSQRTAVAMALSDQAGYTDADTLWLSMREQRIQVSRATVYKALIWLVEAGFVYKKMDKVDGHQTALYAIR